MTDYTYDVPLLSRRAVVAMTSTVAGWVRTAEHEERKSNLPGFSVLSPTEAQVYLTHAASFASLLILPLIPTSNYWGFLSCMKCMPQLVRECN